MAIRIERLQAGPTHRPLFCGGEVVHWQPISARVLLASLADGRVIPLSAARYERAVRGFAARADRVDSRG